MKHINFLTKQENWTKGIIKKSEVTGQEKR